MRILSTIAGTLLSVLSALSNLSAASWYLCTVVVGVAVNTLRTSHSACISHGMFMLAQQDLHISQWYEDKRNKDIVFEFACSTVTYSWTYCSLILSSSAVFSCFSNFFTNCTTKVWHCYTVELIPMRTYVCIYVPCNVENTVCDLDRVSDIP